MISTMKILFWILPLGVILLIAIVNHSPSTSGHADNVEKIADLQIIRHRRAVWPSTIHYCKVNQYYDHEEGRCLGVPGGGKVLHVESRRSCGVNILKPHCRSSLYYHICKRDKSILAQCANRQIFDNRLQRCVYYDSSKLIPNIIPPDEYMYHHHISVPSCTRSGRFPIPSHCSMFYTCDSNGHRFYQNVFKCPQNTGYHMDRGMCIVVPDCVNDNSVDPTVCVPNAPGENVESLNPNTEGNVKETSVIFEGNKASTSDSIVENEENVNFKSYDDVTATSVNIMDTPSENNANNHDSDTDDTSLLSSKSIKEVSVPDDINEMMMHSQISDSPENAQTIPDERQNEENESLFGLQITSPSTIEFDDASHSITISMTSIKPEYRTSDDIDSEIPNTASFSPDSYILSKLNEETQDVTTKQYKNIEDGVVTLSNFNSEAIDPYPTSTILNAPEIPAIDDVSYKTNENIQDIITEENIHNEDAVTPSNFNIDSFDSHSASIVSDVPESSPVSDILPKINEEIQDAITEEYKNIEDNRMTPLNFNADSVDLTVSDVPSQINEEMPDAITEKYKNIEDNATSLSPINDMPSEIDEEVPDAITEKYRNNEDSAVSPSNFNTDSVDLYSAPTVSDVPESSPINDVPSEIGEEVPDAIMEKYRNNEDSAVSPSNYNTDSVDLYSAPTASDVPESSPINDMPSEIGEEVPDAITEKYKNNEDSAVSPSNFNTDSVDLYSASTVSDVPESSPINDMPSEIGEEVPVAITEKYRNNEDSAVSPSNFNTDSVDLYSASTVSDVPESSPINDMPSEIGEEVPVAITEKYKNNEDSAVSPSNFNTDSVDLYSASTVSDIPESSPINDMPSEIGEEVPDAITEKYRNNEDSAVSPSNYNTDSVNLYSVPTASDVPESSPISDMPSEIDEMPDAITEEYRNIEDSATSPSPINDMPSEIGEEVPDAITEAYRNIEDSSMTPSNFNTDSVDLYSASTISDLSEPSLISDPSSKLDEETQNVTTEMYKKDDGTLLNPIIEDDQNPTALNDTPATENIPRNYESDVLSSTPAILSPQTAIDGATTEGLFETVPLTNNKFEDTNSTLDGENISTQYLSEDTDNLYLTTTRSISSLEDITESNIATTPFTQDLPVSDPDLITQVDENSKEVSQDSLTE
ncbi:hypothetical protein P5V15_013099 [Pogonomyrmex californicus]